MVRKGAIKLNDIRPGRAYMVRDGKEFLPVTIVCNFTQGWLRGWVRLDLDPLWTSPSRQKYIYAKPFNDSTRDIGIAVERIGDEFYCQSYMGLTLFHYEKGWFNTKRTQLRNKIAELQRELELLAGIDPEHEDKIQRRQLMREERYESGNKIFQPYRTVTQ